MNGKPYRVTILDLDGAVLTDDRRTRAKADAVAWKASMGHRIDRVVVTDARNGAVLKTYGRFGKVL